MEGSILSRSNEVGGRFCLSTKGTLIFSVSGTSLQVAKIDASTAAAAAGSAAQPVGKCNLPQFEADLLRGSSSVVEVVGLSSVPDEENADHETKKKGGGDGTHHVLVLFSNGLVAINEVTIGSGQQQQVAVRQIREVYRQTVPVPQASSLSETEAWIRRDWERQEGSSNNNGGNAQPLPRCVPMSQWCEFVVVPEKEKKRIVIPSSRPKGDTAVKSGRSSMSIAFSLTPGLIHLLTQASPRFLAASEATTSASSSSTSTPPTYSITVFDVKLRPHQLENGEMGSIYDLQWLPNSLDFEGNTLLGILYDYATVPRDPFVLHWTTAMAKFPDPPNTTAATTSGGTSSQRRLKPGSVEEGPWAVEVLHCGPEHSRPQVQVFSLSTTTTTTGDNQQQQPARDWVMVVTPHEAKVYDAEGMVAKVGLPTTTVSGSRSTQEETIIGGPRLAGLHHVSVTPSHCKVTVLRNLSKSSPFDFVADSISLKLHDPAAAAAAVGSSSTSSSSVISRAAKGAKPFLVAECNSESNNISTSASPSTPRSSFRCFPSASMVPNLTGTSPHPLVLNLNPNPNPSSSSSNGEDQFQQNADLVPWVFQPRGQSVLQVSVFPSSTSSASQQQQLVPLAVLADHALGFHPDPRLHTKLANGGRPGADEDKQSWWLVNSTSYDGQTLSAWAVWGPCGGERRVATVKLGELVRSSLSKDATTSGVGAGGSSGAGVNPVLGGSLEIVQLELLVQEHTQGSCCWKFLVAMTRKGTTSPHNSGGGGGGVAGGAIFAIVTLVGKQDVLDVATSAAATTGRPLETVSLPAATAVGGGQQKWAFRYLVEDAFFASADGLPTFAPLSVSRYNNQRQGGNIGGCSMSEPAKFALVASSQKLLVFSCEHVLVEGGEETPPADPLLLVPTFSTHFTKQGEDQVVVLLREAALTFGDVKLPEVNYGGRTTLEQQGGSGTDNDATDATSDNRPLVLASEFFHNPEQHATEYCLDLVLAKKGSSRSCWGDTTTNAEDGSSSIVDLEPTKLVASFSSGLVLCCSVHPKAQGRVSCRVESLALLPRPARILEATGNMALLQDVVSNELLHCQIMSAGSASSDSSGGGGNGAMAINKLHPALHLGDSPVLVVSTSSSSLKSGGKKSHCSTIVVTALGTVLEYPLD